ncbi:unnamed protein product [Caenorhabditis auriculariae]|uniref:Uncharacterized protein n=1 Tax=Caenorhabditis auriculariae TaxID=2777116 RepID=A0A8S1HDL8_9PELO|nr:unnamed protein product [Caenorhabditis auriculariae]
MAKSEEILVEKKRAHLGFSSETRKQLTTRKIDVAELEKYYVALNDFKEPSESELIKGPSQFRQHPNYNVEKYFAASAGWGVPAIPWEIVRPAFVWKLKFVIDEFVSKQVGSEKKTEEKEKVETKKPDSVKGKSLAKITFVKPVPYNIKDSSEYILRRASEFEGFPFTWQRLCELLVSPTQHYSKVEKFLRALEKVISVVTAVTEWGKRITGEWEVPSSNDSRNIENRFFGRVDELDGVEQGAWKKDFPSIGITNDTQPIDMSRKRKGELDSPNAKSNQSEENSPVKEVDSKKSKVEPLENEKGTDENQTAAEISKEEKEGESSEVETKKTEESSPKKEVDQKDEVKRTTEKESDA